jgi:hydroxymethylbilane synthase
MPESGRKPIRIGTRGSPLALAQTEEFRARLLAAHADLSPDAVEIRIIRTTGDQVLDRPLSEIGGKGLFTKEIEEALLDGRIDLAVHSMKDMPTLLPEGLSIPCLLPREDPRDAFISHRAATLAGLAPGARVGTSSLRRQAQLKHYRPDLVIVPLRGNVQTRLAKLAAGEMDATILALAGLRRLGRETAATAVIGHEQMLPAAAQGAIGVEMRENDAFAARLLRPLNHPATEHMVQAERAFLAALDGSCRTPIAALAEMRPEGRMRLRGQILRHDGSQILETERLGAVADAARMGFDAGMELRRRGGDGFFTQPA